MNLLTRLLMALVCLLAACSKDEGKEKTTSTSVVTYDTEDIASNKLLSPANKAEQLALIGEDLLTPVGFMFADVVFDQALSFDSTNPRALFYKNFLSPYMAFRGFLARVEALATTAKERREYADVIKNFPDMPLKTFLLDGRADFDNEPSIQGFFQQIHDGVNQFRNFLKNNKGMVLTLNWSEWANVGIEQLAKDCGVTQVRKGVYEIKRCPHINLIAISLNRADVEGLQFLSAGFQIYFATFIAYDFTGSIATSKKFEKLAVTNKEIYAELSKYSDFGKVRDPKTLQNVVEMGTDAIAGVRWAMSIQKTLCPKGYEDPSNRRGYLFNKGICIHNDTGDGTKMEDTLKVMENVFLGFSIPTSAGKKGEIKTEIRPIEIFRSPIADLKSLNPTFNKCGNVVSVSDDTLGGYYPNHDANQVLSSESECP